MFSPCFLLRAGLHQHRQPLILDWNWRSLLASCNPRWWGLLCLWSSLPCFYPIPTAPVVCLTQTLAKPQRVSWLWICTSHGCWTYLLNRRTQQVPTMPKSSGCFLLPSEENPSAPAPPSLIWSLSCSISCPASPEPAPWHPQCPSLSFCLLTCLVVIAAFRPPPGWLIFLPAWMPFSHHSASQMALPPPKPRSSVTSAKKPFPKTWVRIKGALLCRQIASWLCLHESTAQGCRLPAAGQGGTARCPTEHEHRNGRSPSSSEPLRTTQNGKGQKSLLGLQESVFYQQQL